MLSKDAFERYVNFDSSKLQSKFNDVTYRLRDM